LIQAAADLLAEPEERVVFQYLSIFWRRDFPLAPEGLFPFLQSTSPLTSHRAARALGRLKSEAVRARALELLSGGKELDLAVSLLWNNFLPGGWAHIEAAIDAKTLDEAQWRRLFTGVSNLIREHTASAASRSILFRLYEEMPCSICRVDIVRGLLASGGLTEAMAQECLRDAEPYVVELVSSLVP